ncbi:MAG: hypothetical protein ACAH11_03880 [Sphingomonas sp.]
MTTQSTGAPAPGLHRFKVTADLCPQAMLRILGLVAQNGLVPRRVVCERLEDRLYAEISVTGLTPDRAEILLAKIATIVTVRDVRLS